MEFILWFIICGIVVGIIARSKGREFFPWFFYGSLLFIIALVHILVAKDESGPSAFDRERTQRIVDEEAMRRDSKTCPYCAESIKRAAVVCRFCGRDVP